MIVSQIDSETYFSSLLLIARNITFY